MLLETFRGDKEKMERKCIIVLSGVEWFTISHNYGQ